MFLRRIVERGGFCRRICDHALHLLLTPAAEIPLEMRSKEVGPSAANHEINALAQVMRLAGCWGRIANSYKPLKEKEWQKPNVFTPREQELIF
jgi:hypothetical protein